MAELKEAAKIEMPCPILKLSTEIIQYIAYLLPKDSDVINLSLTCFLMADRILPAASLVWSYRFRDLYDTPKDRSSRRLKIEYQIRAIVLPQQINFSKGENEEQTLWLEVIQNMLAESFTLPFKNRQPSSKTFKALRRALFGSEFLNRPVSGYGLKRESSPSDLFCAVQLCLTDLALDPSMRVRCRRADYDVGAVYSYEADVVPEQLVSLVKLDLEKILHIRNFWLRHLMDSDEGTFYESFSSLPEWHRPKGRKRSPDQVSELSMYWLGYYSCIHPQPETLASLEDRQSCADLNGHWQQVEPMFLQISPHPDPLTWPTIFDEMIPVLGRQENCTYFRGTQRIHGGNDDATHFVFGFMESIPQRQGGFSGWNRICFAIFKPKWENLGVSAEPTGREETEDALRFLEGFWPAFDFEWVKGYEGVMLPGERIFIGRWLDMRAVDDRGPFIFWDI